MNNKDSEIVRVIIEQLLNDLDEWNDLLDDVVIDTVNEVLKNIGLRAFWIKDNIRSIGVERIA